MSVHCIKGYKICASDFARTDMKNMEARISGNVFWNHSQYVYLDPPNTPKNGRCTKIMEYNTIFLDTHRCIYIYIYLFIFIYIYDTYIYIYIYKRGCSKLIYSTTSTFCAAGSQKNLGSMAAVKESSSRPMI